MKIEKENILHILSQVVHPEKRKDIVSLGMVQSISIEGNKITINYMPSKVNDPFTNTIRRNSESLLKQFYGDGISVDFIVMPIAKNEKINFNSLSGVKNIIAVSSGKGGVGKSTIAVNLAVAMAMTGAKVGLLDADLYGPSTPTMFGATDYKPETEAVGEMQMILPLEKYGVKILSIGFFVDPKNPLIWRGPMATGALKQLIHQTQWGELDYLFIDMPPGTGDIHISIVQEMAITGAVIVSTPQRVALADVVKGIAMFQSENVNVPVLGLIENMSWFTPQEYPDKKYFIFGKEGCSKIAAEYDIPVIGQIPIVESICDDSDQGHPSALDNSTIQGKAFSQLAEHMIESVKQRNNAFPPTKKVEMKKN